MRVVIYLVLPLLFFGCSESDEHIATTLTRTEAKSYSGFVLHTIYEHDRHGRITAIKESRDDEDPVVAATISYSENEVLLLSTPDWDPSVNQTKRVLLILGEKDRPQKRIEFTHKIAKEPSTYESFIYDTLLFQYNASGFLIETQGTRYDSTWIDETNNRVMRATSNTTYIIQSGNLIASVESVDYPITIRNGNSIVQAGGSSEYHTAFQYTKSYPNKTDFKNAIIMNEYKQSFEPLLDMNFVNMPDQVTRATIDRDVNGNVIFDSEYTIEMERIYNGNGMLSSLRIPEKTQFVEVNYFYR